MTYQAMLAETLEDVQSWSKQGYYGVEMETATISATSKYFKVPSASVLYVGDNLIKGQVIGDDSYIEQQEMRYTVREEVYKAGILTLLEN